MKSGTERQALVALAVRHNWKNEASTGRTGARPMLAGGMRILSLTPARWGGGRSPLLGTTRMAGIVALRTTATAVAGMSARGAETGTGGGIEVEAAVGSQGSMATDLVTIEAAVHGGSGIVGDRRP